MTKKNRKQTSVPMSIRFNMRKAFIGTMEAKCVAGKVKPSKEIGLILLHKFFGFFFAYYKYMVIA